MTTEQIEKVKDLFGGDYTPKIIEDSDIIDLAIQEHCKEV